MAKSFLDKRIGFCLVKGMIEAKKDSETLTPAAEPVYCEYASAQDGQVDPFCELAEVKASEVKECPLEGNQGRQPAFKDSQRDTTMQISLLNCKVDPDEIYITCMFGMTERGRFHIMRRSQSIYCRGLADIIQIKHIETMPAAKVCKHCVNEYLKYHYEKLKQYNMYPDIEKSDPLISKIKAWHEAIGVEVVIVKSFVFVHSLLRS